MRSIVRDGGHDRLNVDIVAGSAVEHILARPTDQHVIPRVAVEDIVAGASDQNIGAVAAIEGELDSGFESGRYNGVVAAEAIDDDAIIGVEVRDRHLFRQTRHSHHTVVAGDRDRVIAVGRVKDDRVRLIVGSATRYSKIDIDIGDVGPGQVIDRDGVFASQCADIDRLRVVHIHA